MISYNWQFKDYPKKNKLKVYSTFACGGGSTMGYKLAGLDVIGANDIDPEMAKVYKKNHNPKYYDLCSITDLLEKELPEEYHKLDILDGSPPCSTFSISGSREKVWKKNKKFREGQSEQVLSDLFFDWIRLVDKLRPKMAIAENVKGMILGNAKLYTKAIIEELDKIEYKVQLFLLNAATMGVPQKRERVFFICSRKDLNLPVLSFKFNEKPIKFSEIMEYNATQGTIKISKEEKRIWSLRNIKDLSLAETKKRIGEKYNRFNTRYIFSDKVNFTITAGCNNILYDYPRKQTRSELIKSGTFPLDYDFLDLKAEYLIGMSVPPLMIYNIARQIKKQIFK